MEERYFHVNDTKPGELFKKAKKYIDTLGSEKTDIRIKDKVDNIDVILSFDYATKNYNYSHANVINVDFVLDKEMGIGERKRLLQILEKKYGRPSRRSGAGFDDKDIDLEYDKDVRKLVYDIKLGTRYIKEEFYHQNDVKKEETIISRMLLSINEDSFIKDS